MIILLKFFDKLKNKHKIINIFILLVNSILTKSIIMINNKKNNKNIYGIPKRITGDLVNQIINPKIVRKLKVKSINLL